MIPVWLQYPCTQRNEKDQSNQSQTCFKGGVFKLFLSVGVSYWSTQERGHKHMCSYMDTYVNVHTDTCKQIHIHPQALTHKHARAHTVAFTHMHKHTYTCTHALKQTNTHTPNTRVCVNSCAVGENTGYVVSDTGLTASSLTNMTTEAILKPGVKEAHVCCHAGQYSGREPCWRVLFSLYECTVCELYEFIWN